MMRGLRIFEKSDTCYQVGLNEKHNKLKSTKHQSLAALFKKFAITVTWTNKNPLKILSAFPEGVPE